MSSFFQLTPENISQAKNLSWKDAWNLEKDYKFNPKFPGGVSKTKYNLEGLKSLIGLGDPKIGGATPLLRKMALSGVGIASKFLGPASFFFDSQAMGNAELPEGYDADQEYFDYYNKYGDNYGDLKIPGSNWRQKLMNQKIQQQKRKIGMPQHLTHTPPSSPIQQVQQNIQTYGNRDRPNEGINTPGGGKGQSPTGGDVAGTPFVRGGRASYFDGGLLSLWPR